MIIKKVNGKYIKNVYKGKECMNCGSVYTILHQIDGEIIEQNTKYKDLSQCIDCKDCNNTLQDINNSWEEFKSGYTIVKCECGREVECEHSRFTNTCICGRDYNFNGELLADRSEWGTETGESYIDVLNPEYDY